jgi:hypothetical protein
MTNHGTYKAMTIKRFLSQHLGVLKVVITLSLLKAITCVNEIYIQGSKIIIDSIVIINVWS